MSEKSVSVPKDIPDDFNDLTIKEIEAWVDEHDLEIKLWRYGRKAEKIEALEEHLAELEATANAVPDEDDEEDVEAEPPSADEQLDDVDALEGAVPLEGLEEEAEAVEAEEVPAASSPALDEEEADLVQLKKAWKEGTPVEGRVFGWNDGGFHVVVGEVAGFCPRTAMDVDEIDDPEDYMDETYEFRIIDFQSDGRHLALSRVAHLTGAPVEVEPEREQRLEEGAVIRGRVSSITDFGAFVDVGGRDGLVHVSEISRQRVKHPKHVLQEGQQVDVKVLKIEEGGDRISLSMKALEPDPWEGVKERYKEGSTVTGTVEHVSGPGAFIELEPGVTALLPRSEMNLPPETTAERIFSPGREVEMQVLAVDPKRRRITLAPEGSSAVGSKRDYQQYKERQREDEGAGFRPLAAALSKLKEES